MVYLAFDVSLNVEPPDLRDSDQLQIDIQQPIRLSNVRIFCKDFQGTLPEQQYHR